MSDLNPILDGLSAHPVAVTLAGLGALALLFLLQASFIFIANTQYGVIERRWGARRVREPFGPMAAKSATGAKETAPQEFAAMRGVARSER